MKPHPEPEGSPNSHGAAFATLFFAVYVGPSMNPTLREADVMEVAPYRNRPVRVGDVVFFLPLHGGQSVVHRVARVTPAGIATRGDNNPREDVLLVQPRHIKGQVVAAWRGQQRRKIPGSLQGQLTSLSLHSRRPHIHRACRVLHRLVDALSRYGWIARLVPVPFRPRAVVFHSRGQDQCRLLLGHRVIGRYDDRTRRWNIQLPFRVFVDARVLPPQAEYHACALRVIESGTP